MMHLGIRPDSDSQIVVGLQTWLYLSMITMQVRDNRGIVNSIVYNVFNIYTQHTTHPQLVI